jgi:hypothetical protein
VKVLENMVLRRILGLNKEKLDAERYYIMSILTIYNLDKIL